MSGNAAMMFYIISNLLGSFWKNLTNLRQRRHLNFLKDRHLSDYQYLTSALLYIGKPQKVKKWSYRYEKQHKNGSNIQFCTKRLIFES